VDEWESGMKESERKHSKEKNWKKRRKGEFKRALFLKTLKYFF
jgi:hypothetical protein